MYVGKGQGRRALEHLSHSSNPRLTNLISNRTSSGFEVKPELIAYCDDEDYAFFLEKALIAYLGREDLLTGTLFNKTDGGDGVSNPSTEVREAQANAMYRRFGGKQKYTWIKQKTGEEFRGTRVDFAKHLNVDQKAVGKLFQGISKGIKGWKLESTEGDINAYNEEFSFVHNFRNEKFRGRSIDFQRHTGISAAAVSMLVKGKIAHTGGWILEGNEHLVTGLKINSHGSYYTPREPWHNANATKASINAWANAQILREMWVSLPDQQRSSIGPNRLCNLCGIDYRGSVKAYQTILKRFKEEDWDPCASDTWRAHFDK